MTTVSVDSTFLRFEVDSPIVQNDYHYTWWNDNYIYRRRMVLSFVDEMPEGHLVEVEFPPDFLDYGKVRSDFDDIEILYLNTDGVWEVLSREVILTQEALKVRFPLVSVSLSETDRYYVYYGNPDRIDQPERPTDEINEWPVVADFESEEVTFTRPGEHWNEGVSRTRNALATLTFVGNKVRMISLVGRDKGIARVRIDGSAWTRVDLFDQEEKEVVVFEVLELNDDIHQLELQVAAESKETSSGIEVNFQRFEYSKPFNVLLRNEEVATLDWSSTVGFGDE